MADSNLDRTNKFYFFIAAILAIFVSAPGRFAYVLVLLVLFNIQIVTVTLFFHLINYLKLERFRNILMSLELVFVTILYKQILIIYNPLMALTLGFCIYLPALSTIAIQFFFYNKDLSLKKHLVNDLIRSLLFSLYASLFFILREKFGYNTFSLPGFNRILIFKYPFKFFNDDNISAGVFFATIPGALVLIAIFLAVFIFIKRKIEIVKKSKIGDEK